MEGRKKGREGGREEGRKKRRKEGRSFSSRKTGIPNTILLIMKRMKKKIAKPEGLVEPHQE